MDKQAAEIERDIQGAKVERVGEGIKITFSSGILFDVDKADLKDEPKAELAELSTILNKYADTNILLAGHTDATGSDEHNYELSRRRAQSVADYLVTQNVNSVRMATEGYGKSQPIADNDTIEGRAQNRRVEVAIWANEKLKKVAKEKTS
jgi:outer membrane protein OmpA-like peptidoglycan-associated protein